MTQEELLQLIEKAKKEEWTELHLEWQEVKQLPKEIGQLTNLQQLDLYGIKLTTLPIEIGQLTNLQYLNLSRNKLTALPIEIGQLTNLQQLDLSNNQLITLPKEIGQLTNLQRLDLSHNQLTALPIEIGQLNNLQQLDLQGNQLKSLPLEISCITQLHKFRFYGNPIDDDSPFKKFTLAGVYQLLKAKERERFKIGIVELPHALRTAFQRYLSFFDDYILTTKGKHINFKVNKHPKGLEIEVEVTPDISLEEINAYLIEYTDYLCKKADDIAQYFTIPAHETEIKLLKLEMENKVAQFEQDVRIARTKNELLAKHNAVLEQVLFQLSQQNIFLQNNQTQLQNTQTKVDTKLTVNIRNHLKIEQVQTDFERLIEALKAANLLNPQEVAQAEKLQDELDNYDAETAEELLQNKGFKNRFGRFIKKVLGKGNDLHTITDKIPDTLNTLKDFAKQINLPDIVQRLTEIF